MVQIGRIPLLLVAALSFLVLTPVFVHAAIVPCGDIETVFFGVDSDNPQPGDEICTRGECTLCDFQILAMNILDFLVMIVVVMAALLFTNAGILYVFSAANPGNIAKAHRIFTNTLIGLIIVLAAYMVIDTVMRMLYSPAEGTQWGPWNDFLCEGSEEWHCRQASLGGGEAVGVIPPATRLADGPARTLLTNREVTIWESSPGATSFEGMIRTPFSGHFEIPLPRSTS